MTPSGGAIRGLILALALACAACDAQDPTPLPTSPPSATPTITAPVAPAAVKSAAGAEAFARYFWQMYSYMYTSGDSSSFLAVSTFACSFCAESATKVDRVYGTGGHIDGGKTTLLAAATAPAAIQDAAVVAVTFRQDASSVVDAKGQVLSRSPADGPVSGNMRLEWDGAMWHTAVVARRDASEG